MNNSEVDDRIENESDRLIITQQKKRLAEKPTSVQVIEWSEPLKKNNVEIREDAELDFSNRLIGDRGAMELFKSLQSNIPEIVNLNLRGNSIGEDGTRALADVLRNSHFLQTLLLEWNEIGRSSFAMQDFANSLEKNTTLEVLDLRNNMIDSETGSILARALPANRGLKELNLSWNDVGVYGGSALARAMLDGSVLKTMMISGCNVAPSDAQTIQNCLIANQNSINPVVEIEENDETRERRGEEDENLYLKRVIELELEVSRLLDHCQKLEGALKEKQKLTLSIKDLKSALSDERKLRKKSEKEVEKISDEVQNLKDKFAACEEERACDLAELVAAKTRAEKLSDEVRDASSKVLRLEKARDEASRAHQRSKERNGELIAQIKASEAAHEIEKEAIGEKFRSDLEAAFEQVEDEKRRRMDEKEMLKRKLEELNLAQKQLVDSRSQLLKEAELKHQEQLCELMEGHDKELENIKARHSKELKHQQQMFELRLRSEVSQAVQVAVDEALASTVAEEIAKARCTFELEHQRSLEHKESELREKFHLSFSEDLEAERAKGHALAENLSRMHESRLAQIKDKVNKVFEEH